MGYPFDRLVPSYATAIGTSGDRPDALAELMGIVVNNGIRLPTVLIERLRFASDTPYETIVASVPPVPVRVLLPDIPVIGISHVCTPVPNSPLFCLLLLSYFLFFF